MSARELDGAGITGPERVGYLVAARLLAAKAKARGAPPVVRHLIPPHKRPYLELLFAFITYLDDIIDDPARSVDLRLRRLDDLRVAFAAAFDGDRSPFAGLQGEKRIHAALARSVAHFLHTWELPPEEVLAYLDFQQDVLEQTSFPTFETLEKGYLDPMAPPPRWANQILGPRTADSDTLCHNATRAFLLIDFLWDLREDMELGRLYLPLDQLARFGLDRESVERQLARGPLSDALCELILFEARRAGELLASAMDWPSTVDVTSRPFVEWDLAINGLKLAELRKGRLDELVRRRTPSGEFTVKALARTGLGLARALRTRREPRAGLR